jgi:uncharacterized protein (TIGR02996 family)
MAKNLSNPELNARILNDRSDVAAFLVYSDWLSERGDPRGELIAVQAKLLDLLPPGEPLASSRWVARNQVDAVPPLPPTDPVVKELVAREQKLREENATTWLSDLTKLESKKDLSFAWRLGFLEGVRVGPALGDYKTSDIDFASTYKTLMTSVPHTQFIHELVIGSQTGDDYPASWQNAIDGIGELGVPSGLTSLTFDCGGYWDISSTELGDLSKAYARLAALRSLHIRMGSMDFGFAMNLPALESLTVITGGLRKGNIEAIALAKWPTLSRLSLCIGETDGDYGCDVALADLSPILDGANLAGVRHLGLCNANYADEIAAALATSKILPQLETLDLSLGTFSDSGAQAMIDHAAAFKHLKSIDLTHHYVSEPLRAELVKIGPEFILADFEDADVDDRYVDISE